MISLFRLDVLWLGDVMLDELPANALERVVGVAWHSYRLGVGSL